jgi:RNA polymerase sigma factor (sigma-70 family)
MANGRLTSLLPYIRQLVSSAERGADTDRQLLEQFAAHQEEAAFATLVQRHGPVVLGVCRRMLQNEHAAEDAFQATFLVLVRKIGSVRWRESVGGWLYAVAYRIALKAKANAAKRQVHEKQRAEEMPQRESTSEAACRDLWPVLDEELQRLPEKYRTPLILCYLEGKTNEEAAQQLGWPAGTVKGRLARARELLQSRLTRRGVAVSGGLLLPMLSPNAASAAMPPALADATVKAAILAAAGKGVAVGGVSATVASLVQEMLKAMLLTKVKIALAALLVGMVGAAAVVLSHPPPKTEQPEVNDTSLTQRDSPPADEPKKVERSQTATAAPNDSPLPEAVGPRMERVQLSHGHQVGSVAFSPDGKILATGGRNSTFRLWEMATGKELRQIQGHPGTGLFVAFSLDGKLLATAASCGDNPLCVWETATGKELRRFQGHLHGVVFVAFGPDSQTLVSVSNDHTVRIWEVASGRELRQFGIKDASCVALSPDGQTLALAESKGNQVHLWDVGTGKERQPCQGNAANITALTFSPDSRLLASGSRDKTIRLWEIASGQEVRQWRGHSARITALAFSRDSRTLASGSSDKTIRLWDAATGLEVRQLLGHQGLVTSLAFSPDNSTLASGSEDTTVLIWGLTHQTE